MQISTGTSDNLSIRLLVLLYAACASRHFGASASNSATTTNGRCLAAADMTVCDPTEAGLCLNQSCVSACTLRHMLPCNCPSEDDNYCYLCCGNAQTSCQPAHAYQIFKPNGERWERDACRRCHDLPDGVACDDKSDRRICLNKKCTANACLDRAQGAYCDLRKSRVCTDGDCRDPCKEHTTALTVCECDSLKSRCELCCFDYRTKQCESAFRRYGIKNRDGRPIARIGLSCNRRHDQCNSFGRCSAAPRAVGKLGPCVLLMAVVYAQRRAFAL